MENTIVITVRDGAVVRVITNHTARVVVIDYDTADAPPECLDVFGADLVRAFTVMAEEVPEVIDNALKLVADDL